MRAFTLPRCQILCLGSVLAFASLGAEVQPLDIDLLDAGGSSDEDGAAPGSIPSLNIALTEHFRYGADSGAAKLGLEATASVLLQPTENRRIQLGVRGEVEHFHSDSPRRSGLQSSLTVHEAYIRETLSNNLSFSFGRQIIAWGQSDFFYAAQLTDVVNPRDFSEPALMDLDDARLPILASRLHRLGAVEWELVATHERRYHRFDRAGGDFDPFAQLRAAGITVNEDATGSSGLNDWFFRIGSQFAAGDLSLVAGRTRRNSPVLAAAAGNEFPALAQRHPPHALVGFSFSRALASAVFKTEQVWSQDKPMGRSDIVSLLNSETNMELPQRNTLQSMVGVDYFGFSDWLLTAELSNEHVFNDTRGLAQPRNEGNLSLQARWTPARRDLEFGALLLRAFPYTAHVARLETAWRLNDQVKLRVGAIWYRAKDPRSFYAPFEHQDRIYSSLEFSL